MYDALVYAPFVYFLSSARVVFSGLLTVKARDEIRIDDDVDVSGDGGGLPSNTLEAGCSNDGSHGGGAAFGGYGGRSSHYDAHFSPCGRYEYPYQRGNGGRSWGSAGGAGGAGLRLQVNDTIDSVLYLNGTVHVRGANGINGGNSGSSGGGSGGGIVVDVRYLRGDGKIAVNGGHGAGGKYGGGGGSGGRAAIHVAYNEWTGETEACGGWYHSSSAGTMGHGGPGTVFWSEGPYVPTRFTTLVVDNCNQVADQAVLTSGEHVYVACGRLWAWVWVLSRVAGHAITFVVPPPGTSSRMSTSPVQPSCPSHDHPPRPARSCSSTTCTATRLAG